MPDLFMSRPSLANLFLPQIVGCLMVSEIGFDMLHTSGFDLWSPKSWVVTTTKGDDASLICCSLA